MQHWSNHGFVLVVSLGVVLMSVSCAGPAQYQLTRLTSNQKGQAEHLDPNLVNGWGLTITANLPIFITDTGNGLVTSYNAEGVPLKQIITVPSASGEGPGVPAGIVFNGSNEFKTAGAPAMFLFGTLDGTISGWSPANGNQAIVLVNNSRANASYNGLAITHNESGNYVYAPDFNNNRVDVYDGNLNFVTSLVDSEIPVGFVPLNVQDIGGEVYVAYANANPSMAGGFIDVFQENGAFVRRLAQGNPLNQPYGFAIAPNDFGPLSNTLLISNNTNSGTINGFDLQTGKFVGTIKDAKGQPIMIDQLWGINFGGGTTINGNPNQLFFAAGPNNNNGGLFGVIEFK